MSELSSLSSLLRTLGDPVRLRLLQLLAAEELSVGELVRVLELPQSTISRHLKALKEEGLAADRPVATSAYYRATLEADLGNGDAPLRDGLLTVLRGAPLAPGDRERMERVLALRESTDGDAFFDRIGARWDALRADCFGATFHLEALLHLLPATWRVADLGAGTGYLLPPLARHFAHVIGVDSSAEMIALAQKHASDQNLTNIELRHGRLEQLPLADGEIDLALAILMLHHLSEVEAAIAEIHRVLKPGGRVLIVELHPHQNERFRAAMADRHRGTAPQRLAQLITQAGFAATSSWNLPHPNRPDHELAPLPGTYTLTATKP